jgi:predicted metalloprotease with PDZ domain
MADSVEYSVDLSLRNAHLFTVEARFPIGGTEVDLKLPVWTPGSYLIREFQRHIQELSCATPEGAPLDVRKVDKATWRVDARQAKAVVARYRVYANDLTVRAAQLDDTHAFFNGGCLFLYSDALTKLPARVTVAAPTEWRVTVALPNPGGDGRTFTARDYDELVDSPFKVGTHELIEFTAQGKPHRLAIWGHAAIERARLREDFIRIVDAAAQLFGDGVPYSDYTFLLMLVPNQYGGLEHARSCALLSSPFSFQPRKKYEELLELVAHEFFHLWNVKRIHPEVLGPFDYQREAYTRCLWVMEGFTSYYDRHLLVRAGLQKPEAYLDKLAEDLAKIAGFPGRRRQSLEEASFDAWIKFYRPDENSPNSSISYYLKGGVVALLLDLEIRSRSAGEKSLDDVMRFLWQRYGRSGTGFPDDAAQALFEEATGLGLGAFFDRHVRGREELDHARLLRTVGLSVQPKLRDEDEPAEPWLGINTREDGEALVVATALDGGPAVDGGLSAGDQLVALDGFRVDAKSWKERLAAFKPGDRVTLHVFRREQLRTVSLTLAERPPDEVKIKPAPDATPVEKALYESWMGTPFPPASD